MKYPAQGCKCNSAGCVKIMSPDGPWESASRLCGILRQTAFTNSIPQRLGARKGIDMRAISDIFIFTLYSILAPGDGDGKITT